MNASGTISQTPSPFFSSKQSIVTAYRDPSATADRDVALEAYTKASEYFRKEFDGNTKALSLLVGHNSILDVVASLEDAKKNYEHQGQKRKSVFKHLNTLSLRIRYYSGVLDALAQNHPEYVALAWGSIKLVLMGVINHAELIEEFAKAPTLISDVLPGIKLNAELYQTEQMRDAVANVYAHIMFFFQRAIRWYSKSSAGRVLSSILNPFELEYHDTVEQIKLCSDTINAIASGANRAEVRDMHIITQLVQTDIQGLYQKLHEMQVQFDEKQLKMDSQIDQVLKITAASKAITESVQLDVSDMKPRVYDVQFSYIITLLSPKITPEMILQRHSSTVARRRHQTMPEPRNQVDIVKCLGQWVSTPTSSMFILRSGPRASATARDHSIDVINYLRSTRYKVFWVLSYFGNDDSMPSITNVLKSLAYQVIRHDSNVLVKFPKDLNAAQFSSDHTEEEWLTFLCLLISRLDKCFLIIETEDLYQSSRQDPEWTLKFVQIFQHLIDTVQATGSLVKALIVTFDNRKLDLVLGSRDRIVTTVQQSRPIPPRLRHGTPRSKGKISLQYSLSRKV